MKNNISGTGVALVTPFNPNGDIDFDSISRLVDHVIEGGVDYIVALGTTAETPTLTDGEKKSIARCIEEAIGGRVPLVVGIGGNNTAETVRCIKDYDLSGVSAVLSVTPYYNKPSQEGLYRHYEVIAGESPVPILLYNVPARTGVHMEPDTILRLAHNVDNILGIKEACGLMPQMTKLLKHRPDGFKVISGDDCLAVPLAAVGGDGVISVAANAFPKVYTDMMRAAASGDTDKTASFMLRLTDVFDALFREGNPAGVKTAMAVKGLIADTVRLPLVAGSGRLREDLARIINEEEI